jgi:hypothetical protein
MNTRLTLTSLTLAALLLVPACNKDKPPTETPDDTTTGDGDVVEDTGEDVEAALPEQDPDPPEIAALYDRYLKGDYEAVVGEANTLREGLTADTQVRAHALASAIAALAAVEGVPEDAKDPSDQALADGGRLDDAEVNQLAHIAHAIYLVRVHEEAEGQAELEAALGLGGPYDALNRLMLAEAHLNQAFGEGEEDTQIKHPERLDDAKAQYEAALDGPPIIQAQAHEGLAAIAKYKREKDAVCTHAQEAENLYASSGATDYVREVPSLLAKDGRCKDFKKAE